MMVRTKLYDKQIADSLRQFGVETTKADKFVELLRTPCCVAFPSYEESDAYELARLIALEVVQKLNPNAKVYWGLRTDDFITLETWVPD